MIKAISSDLDGAELRREEKGRYIRCSGKGDEVVINECINSAEAKIAYFIDGDNWERIFGKSKCQDM